MRYSLAHQTMLGTRQENQDRLVCAERGHSVLMVVADGLGGYAGGGLAAQTVVDTFTAAFENIHQTTIDEPAAFLVLTIAHGHAMVRRRARKHGLEAGQPKTTCVACLVQDGYAYWGHVGDSRLYLFRDGRCLARTQDHSTAQAAHAKGMINEHELRTTNAQLLRCIGANQRPEVALGAETLLRNGDSIILCTDGVWRSLTDDQLAEYASSEKLDEAVVDLLIHAERDSHPECDNISAVMFRWEDTLTTRAPRYACRIPDIDQSRIWKQRPRKGGASTSKKPDGQTQRPLRSTRRRSAVRGDSIESSIKEIETFIDAIDDHLPSRRS